MQIRDMFFDFCFMGDESETVSYLAVKSRNSESYLSCCWDSKTSGSALEFLVVAIKELGYKRLTLKSHHEPAILKLKDDVSVMMCWRVCQWFSVSSKKHQWETAGQAAQPRML